MKIYLLKENLKPGLGATERIAVKNLSLPILENVLISIEKNFLKLIATNLENTVIYSSLGKVEKEGLATVPVKIFSSIIRSIDSDKITIEKHGNDLFICGGNDKLRLKCQNSEEFPMIPKIKTEKKFTVNSSVFVSGINQVLNTVSASFNRPELSGVYFRIFKDGIVMASTDSFRLSEKRIKWSQEHNPDISEEYSFIVPAKILNDVALFFSDMERELEISIGEGQIVLDDSTNPQNQIKFISKLIEGDFPSYQEIIPNRFDATVTLNKPDLLDKIRAASILSTKTNEFFLSISPRQKRIEIISRNPDAGEYRSYLTGQGDGEEVGLEFNWRYIADGLTNIKSQEILFGAQKNGGPALIRPVGDDSYLYVVMPIRSI